MEGSSAGGDAGEAVQEAVRVLEAGGLLVHPTQTVYGIGAGPRERDAEIARLKGRPSDRPLLRIGADVEALRRTHPDLRWDDRVRRLAGEFWPGPLTVVLPDGTRDGLGVRVEGHPVTRRILAEWGGTMSSTSLNVHGEAPARTAGEAAAVVDAMPSPRVEAAWVDVGDLPPSEPSTLVSLLEDRPRVLREGAVPRERVAAVLGMEVARG